MANKTGYVFLPHGDVL